MSPSQAKRTLDRALDEINAVADGYTGDVIWNDSWCSQSALCLEICYLISKFIWIDEEI